VLLWRAVCAVALCGCVGRVASAAVGYGGRGSKGKHTIQLYIINSIRHTQQHNTKPRTHSSRRGGRTTGTSHPSLLDDGSMIRDHKQECALPFATLCIPVSVLCTLLVCCALRCCYVCSCLSIYYPPLYVVCPLYLIDRLPPGCGVVSPPRPRPARSCTYPRK